MSRIRARDIMTPKVRTVKPDMRVPDLEHWLIDEKLRGAPVVQDGCLVGVVSRSDIVRQLCVERSFDASLSDYHFEMVSGYASAEDSLAAIGRRVGARVEDMHVRDVMIRDPFTIEADTGLREVAELLIEHHIHRAPVVEKGLLVGVLSALDVVRLVSKGQLVEASG